MEFFKIKSFNELKMLGSIAPSSHNLIEKCCKNLKCGDKLLILGVGNGCFLTYLYKYFGKSLEITAIELNLKFYDRSKIQFNIAKNINVINDCALNYLSSSDSYYDSILCTLPLNNFSLEFSEKLLELCSRKAKSEFIMYTYFPNLLVINILKQKYRELNYKYVFFNLPPSLIINCVK
jgi:phospholipid N-methyltransferase